MKKITSLIALLTIFIGITPNAHGQSVAYYDISVTTIWNMMDHSSVPGGAHWSDLIGATHNTAGEFVNLMEMSSIGIRNVAENGYNVPIIQEINDAIAANRADQLLQVAFPDGAEVTTGFMGTEISADFPFVTLVSMVAPSPDWFIAANSVHLRSGNPSVNNGWKETFTMDLFAYDAGSDLGMNYGDPNEIGGTGIVTMINGFPIFGNRMGTITFTYDSSTLHTETNDAIKTIKIYPNPSQGLINISNIQTANVNRIEVYSILGSLVYNQNILRNSSNISLDLKALNSGIYLLKIKTADGNSLTQKLILE
jgi:hypothetical protein